MALRGNLKDFSLPDVFQLVAYSRKTGVLRIRRPDGTEGGVWFRDGDVFFARSDWHGELLGERLVAAQRITPAALEKALSEQAVEPAGGRRLGRILVDEGYITEGVLEAFVQEQIQDTIFDLMRWEEGDFDFEVLPESVDEDIGLAVSLENIVMEGSRRLEEWERIRRKIPSMDVVFKMATAPGEGSFEISLKPVEWSLLLLVDGTRSVEELARSTNRTDFEVARIVYGLVSAGLLEFAEGLEVESLRAERSRREARQAEVLAEEAEAAAAQAVVEPVAEPAPELEPESGPPVELAAEPEGAVEPSVEAELEEPAPEPVEEPEFLAGEQAASAHDLSVFEEMVAAVLEHPAAPQPEPVVVEPHVPEELPAAMVAQPEPEAAFGASEAADLLGLEPVEQPEVAEAEPEAVIESEVEPQTELETAALFKEPAEAAEPEALAAEPLAEEPVAEAAAREVPIPDAVIDLTATEIEISVPVAEPEAHDFERDLMSLGLGELPPEAGHEELEEAEGYAPEPEPAGQEIQPPDLSELISGSYPEGEAEELGAVAAEAEAIPGETLAAEVAEEPRDLVAGESDLESLLASLDAEPEPTEPTEPTPAPLEAEEDQVGLNGELNDELSALTGADRPTRPSATVSKLPQPGTTLCRDGAIDRLTLLQIIDGIQKL